MKLVLLEVSHWHVPLYVEPLAAWGVPVLAVSDRDEQRAAAVGRRLGARVYTAWRELLAAERPDLALVFGRHAEMAAIGSALVDQGVPFIIEKPAGLNAAEVRALCERARTRGLFVAVPLVQEFGPLATLQTAATRHPGPFHVWFRFVAGPPSRYPASGSPWMLDPAQSGGGCFINLAAHFLHLALKVLPRVSRVWARMSSAVYREPVEDHALVVLEGSDGGSAVIETGYLFPAGSQRPREVYYSLLGRDACHVWWGDRAGHAISGHPWSEEPVNLDSDPLYPEFLRATLAAFQAGHPAPVGLDALVPLMEVIDAAYASATSGQPIAVSITAARDRDV